MKKIRAILLLAVITLVHAGEVKAATATTTCCDSPDCCAHCNGC